MSNRAWAFAVVLLVAAAVRIPEPTRADVAGSHYLFQVTGDGAVVPYYVDDQGLAHTLDLNDPAFQKALLAGTDAVVELPVGNQALTLGGSVQGQVENAAISFIGELHLLEDFSYSTGPVSATLKAGGSLSVAVEKSSFRAAEFILIGDVDVQIKGQTLSLAGTVDGTIEADLMLGFRATLTVMADFVYERGPVKATLGAGGSAAVTVEADAFVNLTFGSADLLATIDVAGTNGLAVQGSAEGKYNGGVLELDASVELETPFTYERKDKTRTLHAGAARLKIHDAKKAWLLVSQPKSATFKLDLDGDSDD